MALTAAQQEKSDKAALQITNAELEKAGKPPITLETLRANRQESGATPGKKKVRTGVDRIRQAVEEKQAREAEALAKKEKAAATPEKVIADVKAERAKIEGEDRSIDRGEVQDVEADVDTEFRGAQSRLIQALEASASGRGPSIAQNQLQQASDRALSQQLALAAQSRTPAQGALAQRLASRQAGEQQQALAGQSGLLRLQEQQQAQQLLAGVSGTARGQDVQTGALTLEAALANQGIDIGVLTANQGSTALQQQQLNDLLGIQGNVATGIASNQQQAASLRAQLEANQQAAEQARAGNRESALLNAAGGAAATLFTGNPAAAPLGAAATSKLQTGIP